MLLEILQNSEENTSGEVSFLINLLPEVTASDLSRVLLLKISCLFHFQLKNEMKKGKYPDRVQIFTFLLEHRFV